MAASDCQTITRLLRRMRDGEAGAAEELLPLVYDELLALARPIFAGERRGHTLQPTALAHEAWIKIAPHVDQLNDRPHFLAVASSAMRQILTDHARSRARLKREGRLQRMTLDGSSASSSKSPVDLLDFAAALEHLAQLNPRHARVVELRTLGGLTIDETAQTLGVSHATVEADWFTAKAWLRTKLAPSHDR